MWTEELWNIVGWRKLHNEELHDKSSAKIMPMFSVWAVEAVGVLSLETVPLFLNSSDVHCWPSVNRILLKVYKGEKDMFLLPCFGQIIARIIWRLIDPIMSPEEFHICVGYINNRSQEERRVQDCKIYFLRWKGRRFLYRTYYVWKDIGKVSHWFS
jgi:hypothetical protein